MKANESTSALLKYWFVYHHTWRKLRADREEISFSYSHHVLSYSGLSITAQCFFFACEVCTNRSFSSSLRESLELTWCFRTDSGQTHEHTSRDEHTMLPSVTSSITQFRGNPGARFCRKMNMKTFLTASLLIPLTSQKHILISEKKHRKHDCVERKKHQEKIFCYSP